MRSDDLPVREMGFGLSELRSMHRQGQLTDEEFERARGKITSAAKAATSQMPDPAGGRRAPGAGRSTGGVGPDNTGRPDRGQ
ncbi:MAG: SHOCT domain-containing protein [Chthoniobacterales bacterium]|nr:SHOCT domain-containing protein [Chthoniobacterales bacterium]